jgi:hypothetical protein
VRVSPEDGLATTIFYTRGGGRVIAYLPLNTQTTDAEIGGSVERQLPKVQASQADEALNEISGTVTVQPHKKQPNFPPLSVLPDVSNFVCPPSDDGDYDVTYNAPDGSKCTATVSCPPPVVPPATPSDTCGIPQLASSNGNLHCTMPASGDPSNNTCLIGGQPATCRAFSGEGLVAHVPPSSQVPEGPTSVIVRRGNKMSLGKTTIARVQMTCVPPNLQPGQPCVVTTTVSCPGLQNVQNGKLVISNYNPAVLNMPSRVVPLPSSPNGQSPSTNDLLKRDALNAVQRLKQQIGNSASATSPENQKLLGTLNQLQETLGK